MLLERFNRGSSGTSRSFAAHSLVFRQPQLPTIYNQTTTMFDEARIAAKSYIAQSSLENDDSLSLAPEGYMPFPILTRLKSDRAI